jgi:hypothetical protein
MQVPVCSGVSCTSRRRGEFNIQMPEVAPLVAFAGVQGVGGRHRDSAGN